MDRFRWLSVGVCSRTAVLLLLFGLPNLAEFIEQDTSASLYYLKGYRRGSTSEGKSFIVRACLACRVAEGVESELMQDNLVALRVDEL